MSEEPLRFAGESPEEIAAMERRDEQLRSVAARLGVQPGFDGRLIHLVTLKGEVYSWVAIVNALLDRMDRMDRMLAVMRELP